MTEPLSSRIPDLPAAEAANFTQRSREVMMQFLGRVGNPLDKVVTLRELLVAGMLQLPPGYVVPSSGSGGAVPIQPGPATGGTYTPDLTAPPMPSGFVAAPAISNIIVSTDTPFFSAGHGYQRTNLYGVIVITGAAAPTFSKAVRLTQFSGPVSSHPVNPATTYALWATWESRDGIESLPAGGANGVVVTTGQDVTALVTALTGPGRPFQIVTASYTLADGTVVPAGTYTSDAYIRNASIGKAQIALLAVDDARIASLSAAKLTAGAVAVGEYIQSSDFISGSKGWRLSGNGSLEASAGTFRGALEAATGTFSGALKAATGTFAGVLQAATGVFAGSLKAAQGTFTGQVQGGSFVSGMYTGYAWPPNGAGGGVYLDPNGLLLGNANTPGAGYFQLVYNGDMYTNGFTIVGGVMTINQLNVVKTLNIAGNAVTLPFTAAFGQLNYGDNAVSASQYVRANSTFFITCVAGVRNLGFKSHSLTVYVATPGGVVQIGGQAIAAENAGVIPVTCGYTTPYDGYHQIFAQTNGEPGGFCTNLTLTAQGAQR